MSTTRRTAGVFSRPRPLGPSGERLCYNCNGLLPKGKCFNCSTKCSEEWKVKTSPAYMRAKVFERDKGICAQCAADTIALEQYYMNEIRILDTEQRKAWLEEAGIPPSRISGDWYDVDHITAVVEGGGECDISNLRTLCIPCHKEATRELHARMRRKRIEARPLPLFDQP